MAYVDPPTWVDNTTPYLNAANLNTMSANQRDHETRINSGLDFTNEARNINLIGGDSLAWGVSADKFTWAGQMYLLPAAPGTASDRYIELGAAPPTSGVLDHTGAERANVNGITINDYESLWLVHTRGSVHDAGNTFTVVPHNVSLNDTRFADEGAFRIATRYGEGDTLWLRNGIDIPNGSTRSPANPHPQYALASSSYRTLYKVSGSDVTNITTSFADVTGLTWAVTSGVHYKFQAILDITSNATTNGFNISMNGPTLTRGSWRISTPPTTGAAPYAPVFTQQVAFNTGTALTALTATSPNLVIIEGFMVCSASGTGAVRFASEVGTGGATITVKIGSSLEVWSV